MEPVEHIQNLFRLCLLHGCRGHWNSRPSLAVALWQPVSLLLRFASGADPSPQPRGCFCIGGGLLLGLRFGLGIGFGLGFGIGFSLGLGFGIGFGFGFGIRLGFCFCLCLGFGIGFRLGFGVGFGLGRCRFGLWLRLSLSWPGSCCGLLGRSCFFCGRGGFLGRSGLLLFFYGQIRLWCQGSKIDGDIASLLLIGATSARLPPSDRESMNSLVRRMDSG